MGSRKYKKYRKYQKKIAKAKARAALSTAIDEEIYENEVDDVEEIPEKESVEENVQTEEGFVEDAFDESVQDTESISENKSMVEETNNQEQTQEVEIAERKFKTKNDFKAHQRKRKTISRVFSTIFWIIGLSLLYLCSSNLYQQLYNPTGYTGFFGIGEAFVVSESMEPQLSPNDLIFYKEAEPSDIAIGDTIVYEKTDATGKKVLVVHDVIRIENGEIVTQGKNNIVPDEPFPESQLVGKYLFKIGKIGVVMSLLSTIWGPIVVIACLAFIFMIKVWIYLAYKQKIINHISKDPNTRIAITSFFDV